MAWSSERKCAFPGCPNLVTGARYCITHDAMVKKSYDESREDARDRGYTTRWEKVRAMKLKRNPICERCEKEGRVTPAAMVHHIDGDSKHHAMDNLMSMCWPCHGKQHSKG